MSVRACAYTHTHRIHWPLGNESSDLLNFLGRNEDREEDDFILFFGESIAKVCVGGGGARESRGVGEGTFTLHSLCKIWENLTSSLSINHQ